MSVEEWIAAQNQARLSLVQCAWYLENRDNLIRQAAAVKIGTTEIARILHMNRGHISKIANSKPGDPPGASQAEGTAQQPEDDT